MATPNAIIRCRTIGHAWDAQPSPTDLPVGLIPAGEQTILYLICNSCECERFDLVDEIGFVIRRRYRHSIGYLRAKDATDAKPTKYEWRRQFLYVAGLTNREGRRK
jgi:hypothetical protein